jgi:MFS transporter, DHA2 family, multidrug resistance protein
VVQNIVHREAMVLTFTDCLLLMACVFAFALMLTPLVRKPRQTVQADH